MSDAQVFVTGFIRRRDYTPLSCRSGHASRITQLFLTVRDTQAGLRSSCLPLGSRKQDYAALVYSSGHASRITQLYLDAPNMQIALRHSLVLLILKAAANILTRSRSMRQANKASNLSFDTNLPALSLWSACVKCRLTRLFDSLGSAPREVLRIEAKANCSGLDSALV